MNFIVSAVVFQDPEKYSGKLIAVHSDTHTLAECCNIVSQVGLPDLHNDAINCGLDISCISGLFCIVFLSPDINMWLELFCYYVVQTELV